MKCRRRHFNEINNFKLHYYIRSDDQKEVWIRFISEIKKKIWTFYILIYLMNSFSSPHLIDMKGSRIQINLIPLSILLSVMQVGGLSFLLMAFSMCFSNSFYPLKLVDHLSIYPSFHTFLLLPTMFLLVVSSC